MMFVITTYYFIAFQPEIDPFHRDGQNKSSPNRPWRVNPIDQYFITLAGPCKRHVAAWLHIDPAAGRRRLEDAFNECVISFCDLQVLTGIGVLVSAYGTLNKGISALHWQIAVFLAWYANLTHQSGLAMLRKHLNQPGRGLERHCRVLAMGTLFVLLLVAMVPTAYFNWTAYGPHAAHPGSYAWCYFHLDIANQLFEDAASSTSPSPRLQDTRGFQGTIGSVVLLFFTFATKLIRLSARLSTLANVRIRRGVSSWFQTMIEQASGSTVCQLRKAEWRPEEKPCSFLRWHLIVKPLLALYLWGRIYADLFTSMISEVYWLWVSTLFLTITLFRIRWSVELDENSFSFGQILPVLLLAGPLGPIVVVFFSVRSSGNSSTADLSPVNTQENGQDRHIENADDSRPQEQVICTSDLLSHANTIRNTHPQQQHDPGMKWAVVLTIVQILFVTAVLVAVAPFTRYSILHGIRPYVVWYLITMPSASYLMVMLCIETCGSKWPTVCGFGVLCVYSVLLFPEFLGIIDLKVRGNEALSQQRDIWTPILFTIGLGLLGLYAFVVVLMACFQRRKGW